MTHVLQVSDIGEQIADPVRLPRQRRRLSTIMARHPRRKGRAYIVSVHRAADVRAGKVEELALNDNNVKLRDRWAATMVGPDDVVVITYLPLGGGGGGRGGGKNIGMMLAMLVFAVVAPMLVGALGAPFAAAGGGLTMLGKLVTTGLVAGLQYFLSQANKPKANKNEERPVYGISGGGNLPRPGDRIPVHYGRTWVNPDLSQPDYFYYEGNSENDVEGDTKQVLMKRMTIGLGEYQIHTIRVGNAIVWQDGAFVEPFKDAALDIIEPGTRSSLVPSSVYSSDQVGGSELPRHLDPHSNIEWAGPFVVVPPGETTKKIQLDYSFPQGLYAVSAKNGKKLQHIGRFKAQYARINEDNEVVGPWTELYDFTHSATSTKPLRFTKYITVPEGRYAVRAQNGLAKYEGDDYTPYDQIIWDGLRAWLDKEPARPGITELAMRVKSGPATGNVPFSDVWVELTRKLPTWNGNSWTSPIATRKAVWAALDILRNDYYGNGSPDSRIDLERFLHYAVTLTENDTCSGTIRGPVSVAEALSTVLGTIRSEPVYNAGIWSMTRDEARGMRKHVITRRQIVKDTSGAEFDLDMGDGASDVIVEYFVGGDPKKRNEYRATIGAETNTPRRISLFGVTSYRHAAALAKWYAAVAYWRREHRLFTTEHLGRMLNRNDPALIDTWFLDETQAAGIVSRSGLTVTLDADVTFPAGAHAMFRNEVGLEWGPVAITPNGTREFTVNSSDATVISNWTGQSFASLFAKNSRLMPETVLIGTVATTRTPYIIRTARYLENGHVELSAVYDAPEVWTILGESLPPDPPIGDLTGDDDDILPILPWVRATVVQKATSLVLEWAVGETRGARGYIIDIKYGDADPTWERIHRGRGADGSEVIDYRANIIEIRVRARAYNAKGVLSKPVYTTAKLFKPTLNGEIADMLIELEHLQDQVRRDILAITEIGEDSLREGLKRLEERIEELANATATHAGTNYEERQLIKIAADGAFAAVKRETTLRLEQDEALAQQIETQAVRLGEAESAITMETLTRVQKDEALSQRIDTLKAELGGDVTSLINEERIARVTADEALARNITTVSSTLDGHTATISQVQESVNGVRAQLGVAIVIDGRAVGGYRLVGVRRNDGTFYAEFGIDGDLVVDGTIWGSKLAASNIITKSAQIADALITNAHIKNATITNAKIGTAQIDHLKIGAGEISTTWGATGEMHGSGIAVEVYVRSGGRCVVIGTLPGHTTSSNSTFTLPSTMSLYVDGGLRSSVTAEVFYSDNGNGGIVARRMAQTWQWRVNGLSEGWHTFNIRLNSSNRGDSGGSGTMTILEFAR